MYILNRHPDTKDFLPQFDNYDAEKLKEFLTNYKSLFLKPNSLYKAQGIVQIIKNAKGYNLKYRHSSGRNKNIHYKYIDNLLQKIESDLDLNDYLMQREIELASLWGNKFDVRVMLQKKEPAKWEVSSINCRIAPVNSIITSPRSGDKVLNIYSVLQFVFPEKYNEIINTICHAAVKIGSRLEEGFGYLGEIGVDFGIDKDGNPWLIEVNGKPLKVSFHRMKDRALTKKINKTPLILGFLLAGFEPKIKQAEYFEPKENNKYNFREINKGFYEPILFLNKKQLEELNLNSGKLLNLKIGFSKQMVKVKKQNFDLSNNVLYLNPPAFYGLDLPGKKWSLNLTSISDSSLLFIPTVGMTVSDNTAYYLEKNEKNMDLNIIAKIAADKGVFFYCFTPESFFWDKNIIEGYYFDYLKDKWRTGVFSLPSVLYDQATYPLDPDKRVIAKETNKKLRKNYEMQVINTKRYFGKWESTEALSFFKNMRKHIPKTYTLTSNNLSRSLNRFKQIYVKSNFGSYGWGVMQVEERKDNYVCKAGGRDIKEWVFKDFESLFDFLWSELGDKTIIQQKISLAKINNNKFD